MENDFPHSVCPNGTSRDCAEGIAKRYQDTCGVQIRLANRTHFHVVQADAETIDPLEMIPDELNTIPVGATFVDAVGRIFKRIQKVKGEQDGNQKTSTTPTPA